jgi:hypothetical protein
LKTAPAPQRAAGQAATIHLSAKKKKKKKKKNQARVGGTKRGGVFKKIIFF